MKGKKTKPADFRVAFIGVGRMGEALVKGLIEAGEVKADQIIISDVQPERIRSLKEKYHVEVAENNQAAVKQASIVLLAVKPQQIDDLLRELAPLIDQDLLLVSIAAGISTELICDRLGRDVRVVRVMPNAPALVGKGISIISRGEHASSEDEELVAAMFSAIGETVGLPERLQNEAMAISGCGPAYFYLFIESLTNAGEKKGLRREIAQKLAVETMIGAGEMLKNTGLAPQELIGMVASPGGTTQAALEVFANENIDELMVKAIDAAVKRAYELGERKK